ncbi:MAG: hypothetical protein AAGA34_05050 [Pseudomonadota bacterium]
MSDGPSALSLAAAALYALVALSCVWAANSAARVRARSWHWRGWVALVILFLVLFILRVTMAEDVLRNSLRTILRASEAYDNRRDWQALVVAGVGLVVAGLAAWLSYRALQGSRRRPDVALMLALAAGFAMIGLVVLRLVSFHWVDRVLNGPLKLNWLGDIGSSLVVLGAASFYVWLMRFAKRGRPQ